MGTFDYAKRFPGSNNKFELLASASARGQESAKAHETEAVVAATPTFAAFAASWVESHQVEWRRSHLKVLRSTLDGHLIPHFGERPVGSITKADILGFRGKLASLPGRGGRPGLSTSRFVPNLTRQDGSAFDRLLATRFASGGIQLPPGSVAPKPSGTGGDGAISAPPGQPPPVSNAAPAPLH